MTREETKELLPIIQAFAEGKTVQFMDNNIGKWIECNNPSFYGDIKYRIKPESKYRPFKNTAECWEEMQKHQPFGWVRYKYDDKNDNRYRIITGICDDRGEISGEDSWTFGNLMIVFTFADGTPFGVNEDAENSD